jgi:prolipoprotein diacylglyceryltransferase
MPLFALAALVSVSCITVGIHSIADVVAGLLFFVFVRDIEKRWYAWVSVADRFANYWRNWRMGPVRIINHGFYVGLAAVCGVVMVELQLAPSYTIPVIIIGLSIIAGAGIWAQFLEGGKDGFSRPFGFYGGIFGAVLGGVVCSTMGYNLVLLLSSFCVAAPLIQALGRLRCLVQGCCHGAMCTTENGLHYHTPLSRPVKAGLQGRPLYPTQLYSIIANVITLGILIRLRLDHSAPEMIIGVYLLLNGVARFIEEHYRGEPQTKEIMGLRTYQWLSIAFVIAGAIFTTQSTELDYSPISIDVTGLVTALSFGILTAFAMGVDFPDSNKRFSRLA